MANDSCFVCGIDVELHLDCVIDGSPYYKEVDEDNHVFCQRDRDGIKQASNVVLTWRSSEDHDLRVVNAAAAGMRIGFEMLAEPVRAFMLESNPLTDRGECEFCYLGIPERNATNADEHKSTCIYARMLRVLIGKPIDSGVKP